MTLEEINKRLKKNPYYQGSQAQKEAEAGVKIQNNNNLSFLCAIKVMRIKDKYA